MHLAANLAPETRENMKVVRGAPKGDEPWASQLHYLACYNEGAYHDGPSRPHLYGVNYPNGKGEDTLGQYGEIIAAAAGALANQQGGAPAGGPAATGPTTGMPAPGGAATAVSPTFQTSISPQISPVFQQTQASPGAVQSATATQYQPGGMFAEGGSAAAAPPMSPYGPSFPDFGAAGPTKAGGFPVSALDPVQFTNIRDFPTAGGEIAKINQSRPFNWTPVIWVGGIAIVGTLALAYMKQRKR